MPPPERNLISPALYAGTNITLVQNGISTIINASGGGGGGDTWRDINGFRPASQGTNADDDEFRDATIDAAWTIVQDTTPAQLGVWTEDGDVLSCYLPGTDPLSYWHCITKPITSIGIGTYIETSIRIMHKYNDYYHIQGLIFTDSNQVWNAGTQVSGHVYFDPANPDKQLNFQLSHMTNFNITNTAQGSVNWRYYGGSLYLRLYYVAADTWLLMASPDGVSWLDVSAGNFTASLTPVCGGLDCSSHGGFTPGVHAWEYFRVGP